MGRRRGRPENDHNRAFGMLEGGMTVDGAAVSFGVHRTTIWRLAQRVRSTGAVKNRPRSSRSKLLTPREECYIRITHIRS
jgi:transposase